MPAHSRNLGSRPDTSQSRDRSVWTTIFGFETPTSVSFREPFMHRYNFAARAARWSAGHWKTAVVGWIAFVAVAVAVGMSVGTHTLAMSEQSSGETSRAEQILDSAGFKTPAAESVLVQSAALTVAEPAFKSTVRRVLTKLRAMPQVTNLRTGAAGLISRDRHAQLIAFDMKGSQTQPTSGCSRCSMPSRVCR